MVDYLSTIGSVDPEIPEQSHYATIQAWEDAKNGDLVTADERQIGDMRGVAFDEEVLIENGDDAYSDGTRYLWLKAESGSEFDHAARSGSRIVSTGKSDPRTQIQIKQPYFHMGASTGSNSGAVGIKYVTTDSSSSNEALRFRYAGSCTVINVVAYQCSTAGTTRGFLGDGTSTNNELVNCLAYDISTSSVTTDATGFKSTINDLIQTNCTAHNIDASSGDDAYGFDGGLIRNCYAGGCNGGGDSMAFLSSGAVKAGSDYNVADDATSSIFTNNLQNKAAADQFESATEGSEDYHLKTGADLIDAGIDFGNDWDIDGAVSGARDDIGCDELVVVGGNAMPMAMNHYKRRRIA